MKKLTSSLKNMLIVLVGICVVVAAILAIINNITQKPIAITNLNLKLQAIKAVTPAFDNNPFNEKIKVKVPDETDSIYVYPAKKGGKLVGYAIATFTKKGFGGLVDIMIGYDTKGHIYDFKVLDMSETPGLGTQMQTFFHGKSTDGKIRDVRNLDMIKEYPLVVAKDGGKVDAISAATISSRAFLDAVNRSYKVLKYVQSQTQQK